MKTKIFLLILFSVLTLKAQSILTIGTGTTLDVSGTADICSDSISGSITGNGTFCGNPTEVESELNGIAPMVFALDQNYPNPFNPSTKIDFETPQTGIVTLSVYNILGEQIKTLVNEERPAGKHSVQFTPNNLASGIYLYRLQAGSYVATHKMLLSK